MTEELRKELIEYLLAAFGEARKTGSTYILPQANVHVKIMIDNALGRKAGKQKEVTKLHQEIREEVYRLLG